MARLSRRPHTRRQILYMLCDTEPTLDGMLEALDATALDDAGYELELLDIAGQDAVLVHGSSSYRPSWCSPASLTTGIDFSYADRHSGAALLIAVDGDVYGVAYGAGRWFIPDHRKDQRFGLRYVLRILDPERVQRLVRRRPGARGRQDSTLIPDGLPIWCYGIDGYAHIVGHIGGEAHSAELTFCGDENRPVRIDGSSGLNLPLAVEPAQLVADIRNIAEVCRSKSPDPALESVENIVPITAESIVHKLESDLEEVLEWSAEDAADMLALTVPMSRIDDYLGSQALGIKIGHARSTIVDGLELEYFLRRTRLQPSGRRLAALRDGTIELFADPEGTESIGRSRAVTWLEATASIEANRYFLMDGKWYEIGANYLAAMRLRVEQLLSYTSSLDLPAWDLTARESTYNAHVPDVRQGYLCLDVDMVRAGIHQRQGFEACDLLGPANELIHVKRASGSEPLSHLFSQALVSVQTLVNVPEARQKLAARIHELDPARIFPEDFMPAKVVFAILLKEGAELSVDTLFPFSQVTLAHIADELMSQYHVEVEVIGIAADPVSRTDPVRNFFTSSRAREARRASGSS